MQAIFAACFTVSHWEISSTRAMAVPSGRRERRMVPGTTSSVAGFEGAATEDAVIFPGAIAFEGDATGLPAME